MASSPVQLRSEFSFFLVALVSQPPKLLIATISRISKYFNEN